MVRSPRWSVNKLGEVAQIVTGNTPSRKITEYYADKGIPWAKIEDLGKGTFSKTSEYLTEKGAGKGKLIPAGSVLISCTGTIGKIGVAGVQMATNQQINALIFDETKVMAEYGYFYMLFAAEQIEQMATRSTIKSVSKKSLAEFTITFPSLHEQQYIVYVLSEAEYILSQKRQSFQRTQEYLHRLFTYMFSDYISITERSVVRDFIKGMPMNGIYKSEAYYGQGTPIIRIANIQDEIINNTLDLRKVELQIDEHNKYSLESGDILINRVNSIQHLGKCALVMDIYENMVFESNMVRIRPDKEKILPEFLFVWLTSKFVKSYISSIAKASVNQASINQQDILNIPIVNIPKEQQMEFVKLFREYNVIRDMLKISTEKVRLYFHTLLNYSFNGSLTNKWSNKKGSYLAEVSFLKGDAKDSNSVNSTESNLGDKSSESVIYNSELHYLTIRGQDFFSIDGKKGSAIEVTNEAIMGLEIDDLPNGVSIKLLKEPCISTDPSYGSLSYLVFGRDSNGQYYLDYYRPFPNLDGTMQDDIYSTEDTIEVILSEKGDFNYYVDQTRDSFKYGQSIANYFVQEKKNNYIRAEHYNRFHRLSCAKCFISCLSKFQQIMFEEFLLSQYPLPIHTALKRVKKRCKTNEFSRYSIQDALNSVQLFEKFGLLEKLPARKIYYFSDEDNRKREVTDDRDMAVTIELWQCTFDDGESGVNETQEGKYSKL